MTRLRKRLTYANVVSTLALFLVLTGGAAYAAHKLTHRSVGTPELKSNAVTTAKIKASAITTRKIKKIAVTTEKIKNDAVTTGKLDDEAVTGDKIDLEAVPFARVVHRASSTALDQIKGAFVSYPLENATYTQKARESDSFIGALDVIFPASCKSPRFVEAVVVLDAPDLLNSTIDDQVAKGKVEDIGSGGVSKRLQLNSIGTTSPTRFEPGAATPHTLHLFVEGSCNSGSGITASFGGIDVIGVE
jgi:methionine-rich copper-binding protein CopC